jgi:hypothetical protein
VLRRGHGPWVVAVGAIPPAVDAGGAEQTTARPASVRTGVKVVLTWRAGRRPAPGKGGSTADGMAPHNGSSMGFQDALA